MSTSPWYPESCFRVWLQRWTGEQNKPFNDTAFIGWHRLYMKLDPVFIQGSRSMTLSCVLLALVLYKLVLLLYMTKL